MRTTFVLIILLAFVTLLAAQSPDVLHKETMKQKEAIKKLQWWIGEWKGEAWTQMGPVKRETVHMTETIKSHLDGTVILVEGVGRRGGSGPDKGEIVHNAFAVVSYDSKAGKYRWNSWRVPGGFTTSMSPL